MLDDDSQSEEEFVSHSTDKNKEQIKPIDWVKNGKSINNLIKELN